MTDERPCAYKLQATSYKLVIVLGIDPGLATTGIGLVQKRGDDLTALAWMTIETKGEHRASRLAEIASDLRHVMKQYDPHLAVVEKLYFQTNVKTAMDVAEARGVVLLVLAEAGLQVLEPNPLEVKLAVTGDGNADKIQMQDMIVRTLKLEEAPKPDDAADALALAVYGAVTGLQATSY